jgi:hypothetical protein
VEVPKNESWNKHGRDWNEDEAGGIRRPVLEKLEENWALA